MTRQPLLSVVFLPVGCVAYIDSRIGEVNDAAFLCDVVVVEMDAPLMGSSTAQLRAGDHGLHAFEELRALIAICSLDRGESRGEGPRNLVKMGAMVGLRTRCSRLTHRHSLPLRQFVAGNITKVLVEALHDAIRHPVHHVAGLPDVPREIGGGRRQGTISPSPPAPVLAAFFQEVGETNVKKFRHPRIGSPVQRKVGRACDQFPALLHAVGLGRAPGHLLGGRVKTRTQLRDEGSAACDGENTAEVRGQKQTREEGGHLEGLEANRQARDLRRIQGNKLLLIGAHEAYSVSK